MKESIKNIYDDLYVGIGDKILTQFTKEVDETFKNCKTNMKTFYDGIIHYSNTDDDIKAMILTVQYYIGLGENQVDATLGAKVLRIFCQSSEHLQKNQIIKHIQDKKLKNIVELIWWMNKTMPFL